MATCNLWGLKLPLNLAWFSLPPLVPCLLSHLPVLQQHDKTPTDTSSLTSACPKALLIPPGPVAREG